MSRRLAYLRENGYVTADGDLRHTKVTNFCLPMLDVYKGDFKDRLLNVYIDEKNGPHMYLIIQTPCDEIASLIERLHEHDEFTESYDDDNGDEFVIKLKVPEECLEDYYKILSGTYSQISTDYKNVLKKYYGNSIYNLNDTPLIINGQVATTMWEILNPSQKKREIIANHFGADVKDVKELISKPDLKYEMYKKVEELFNITE